MKSGTYLAAVAGLLVAIGLVAPTPAYAVADATFEGVITMPDGSIPDGTPTFNVCTGSQSTSCNVAASSSYDAATGAYSVIVPGGVSYRFGVTYQGANPDVVASVFLYGEPTLATAASEFMSGGRDLNVDLQFIAGASITGALSGNDAALTSATITATTGTGLNVTSYSGTFDAGNQTYLLQGLPAGTYQLAFSSGPRYETVTDSVTVSAGEAKTGIDEQLVRTTSIAGHLFADDGSGAAAREGALSLIPASSGAVQADTTSDAVGAYEFDGVTPGSYRICATGDQYVLDGCWGGGDKNSAPTVTVTANQVVTGDDITLDVGGELSATVEVQNGVDPPAVMVNDGQVDVWKLNDAATSWDVFNTYTVRNGSFDAQAVPVGTYRVEFRDLSGDHSSQWWDDHKYFGETGEDITVTPNTTFDLGTVILTDRVYDVYRTYDQDRFSGAVAMSQANYYVDGQGHTTVPVDGVPVVYIANGLNYPDALSAGPAAIKQHGVLLLVLPTSIPTVVATELTRLHPQKIVIVGGPASVSDGVEAQLRADALHDNYPTEVSRQSGADRFEASRNLASAIWDTAANGKGATSVFIATGNNFPDALDAGPAAGTIDAPVILVNGLLSHLDSATTQLLLDLGTTHAYIAGGPGSVTPGIETDLASLLGGTSHVTRFTGSTRYDAAAAINETFFPTTEVAFVATGTNFPDALAGAPLAGAVGGPIYLSQPTCLPQIVGEQIYDGDTQGIWLLGGPASISPAGPHDNELQYCSS